MTTALLRGWPLPAAGGAGGKDDRGRVLVVAGSREMPGAAVLAAEAALRAGAGKVCVATAASIAAVVAAAVPEARVIGLPETAAFGLDPAGADALPDKFDAVLVGPGLQDEGATVAFAERLLRRLDLPCLLDALALGALHAVAGRPVLLTPHGGELAHLRGEERLTDPADLHAAALAAAREWQVAVALKAAITHLALPDGRCWRHEGGNPGLGVSGSGDVLAGLIVGLLARGASLEQAAVWGIAMHARAGDVLALSVGPLGYLARELAAEVPRLMGALA